MKKNLVFAIFSVLAFLSNNPKANANTNKNAFNPMENNSGIQNGIKFAGCSLDNTLSADTINNMKNAIDAVY